MGCLGNIIWFLCGGFLSGLGWLIAGLLWSITIVGIPIGIQCFKIAGMTFCPFGKDVSYEGHTVSFLVNILWILITGWELAVSHVIFGGILCITVIGIPFGLQHFKLAKLALMPFGARIH